MTKKKQEVVVEEPQKQIGLIETMAGEYGLEPKIFKATIMAAAVGGGKNMNTLDLAQLLLVAHQYNLNPVTKEIYAFPSRYGLQPLVGIDGWLKLANSHPEFDGIQTEVVNDKDGNMIGMTASVWRKDRSHPVVETEFLSECRKSTEIWKRMPNRMMKHRAKAQAIRTAFGFAGIYLPDEFDLNADLAVDDAEVKPNGKGLDDLAASVIKEDPVVLDNETGEIIKPKKKGAKNVRKNDKQTRDAAEAH